MRVREITVWAMDLKEGDRFLRHAPGSTLDGQQMLMIQREAPDLPKAKGTMGYATIERDGTTIQDVLLVRVYGEDSTHPHAWVAPFQNGNYHTMSDEHIVEFTRMDIVPSIDRRTMEDAIIDGSSSSRQHLEFVGVNVRGIYNAVALLLYPPSE